MPRGLRAVLGGRRILGARGGGRRCHPAGRVVAVAIRSPVARAATTWVFPGQAICSVLIDAAAAPRRVGNSWICVADQKAGGTPLRADVRPRRRAAARVSVTSFQRRWLTSARGAIVLRATLTLSSGSEQQSVGRQRKFRMRSDRDDPAKSSLS